MGDTGLTAARSSSTPTVAPPGTAAARSRARTRRRSTARLRTPRATSRRTSSRPASPTAASSRSRTRSGSRTRSRSRSQCFGTERIPSARIRELVRRALRPAARGDPARPRPAPSDLRRRRLRTATSVATSTTSRGSETDKADALRSAAGLAARAAAARSEMAVTVVGSVAFDALETRVREGESHPVGAAAPLLDCRHSAASCRCRGRRG